MFVLRRSSRIQARQSMGMDLVTLLAKCSPLLDACIGGDIAVFRILRLVSKEARQVALQAPLSGYVVTLRGEGRDTKDGVAGPLLIHTRLQDLSVCLHLSGAFNPAAMLETFVIEMRAALSSVRRLDLLFEDDSGGINDARAVSQALLLLLERCPALKNLCIQGCLSLPFLSRLGNACPLISAVTIRAGALDSQNSSLQNFVLLLPSLLPHVTSLTLEDQKLSQFSLPDMSKNTNLLSLDLPTFVFEDEAQWLSLPPNLQHLRCLKMVSGPPPAPAAPAAAAAAQTAAPAAAAADWRVPCRSLMSMRLVSHSVMSKPLARLLLAAPTLKTFQAGRESCITKPKICCPLNTNPNAASAADLSVLLRHMGLTGIKNATYEIVLTDFDRQGETNLATLVAALPCMAGISRCMFINTMRGELAMLLPVFPHVKSLVIESSIGLDDTELLALVAYAPQLTHLKLVNCHSVGKEGLIALCVRHDNLRNLNLLCCAHTRALIAPQDWKHMHMLVEI